MAPQSVVNIQGRTLTTDFDLDKALQFVKKHSLNSNPLIWIDDLELWNAPQHPLSENIRKLIQFINSSSSRIFFMVSMHTSMQKHLVKMHEIHRIFQAEINLGRMSTEEIRQAILIRHGATHTVLTDDEGREISPQMFRKATDKVRKITDGNIGEALMYWANGIQNPNTEKVQFKPLPPYVLPEFMQADTGTLLSAIVMEKRTNEFRLRKLFGPVFKEKYAGIIQRLLSTGLLIRRMDGWIELNDVVANPVTDMLERHGYL